MRRKYFAIGVLLTAISSLAQTPAPNSGHMVTFGMGEMKDPITLLDRDGKEIFSTFLDFEKAFKTYIEDAVATNSGTVVAAASAANHDGSDVDMIVEVGPDGIRHVIRTSPFYPMRICVTDKGTVWAYGQELSDDRRHERRAHFAVLREFSFERGELRSALDRADIHLTSGIPLSGSLDEFQMRCNSEKLAILNGPSREFMEYDLAKSELYRWPLAPLPNGVNINKIKGAALTDAGDMYVSMIDAPHVKALTRILKIHVNESGIAEWLPMAARPSGHNWFVLKGSDGDDLVYSLGGNRTPTLFWSGRETTK